MYNNDNSSRIPQSNNAQSGHEPPIQNTQPMETECITAPQPDGNFQANATYEPSVQQTQQTQSPQNKAYESTAREAQSAAPKNGRTIFDEDGYYHYAAPRQDGAHKSQADQSYQPSNSAYPYGVYQYGDKGDVGMNQQSGWNRPSPVNQQPNPQAEYKYQPPYIPMDDAAKRQVSGGKKQKTDGGKRKFSWASLVAVACASALLCGTVSSASVAALMHSRLTDTSASNSASNSAATTPVNMTTQEVQTAITAVAQKVSPSVVGIRVSTSYGQGGFYGSLDGSSNGTASEGSGVVYTSDGYIITNYHVISAAVEGGSSNSHGNPYGGIFGMPSGGQTTTKIQVYLASDRENALDAQLVGYDVSADLAVLKVDKTDLPAVEIGDSESLAVGQNAIAIGSPGGLDFMGSVSSGIISGLNRKIQTENGVEMNLIQTDAAINPGNSGGALVDINGKLIGINNSKMAGESFEGMGFSIPVNEVVEICDRIIHNENSPTPYLGVTIDSSYDSDTLQRMGYPAGVVVNSVAENSPAAAAGIKRGDIITAINGAEITSFAQLSSEKSKYAVGDTIGVTIYRSGQSGEVKLTLGQSSEG